VEILNKNSSRNSDKKYNRCLLYLNCTEHFGHLRCRHRDINAALDIREIGMWYLKTCYRWILHKQHNNEIWNNAIWMSEITADDIRPPAFRGGAN
jgi:hypothetical protein